MAEISLGRLLAVSVVAGAGLALGIMAAVAGRAVWTISRGHRWYQLRNL